MLSTIIFSCMLCAIYPGKHVLVNKVSSCNTTTFYQVYARGSTCPAYFDNLYSTGTPKEQKAFCPGGGVKTLPCPNFLPPTSPVEIRAIIMAPGEKTPL